MRTSGSRTPATIFILISHVPNRLGDVIHITYRVRVLKKYNRRDFDVCVCAVQVLCSRLGGLFARERREVSTALDE